MTVVLASSSRVALPSLEMLRGRADLELLGLLTTPDRPKGRSGRSTPNELAEMLAREGLTIWKPGSHEELRHWANQVKPELVIVIAYGRLIPLDVIESVPEGWINLHFSLLPSYRGAAPVQRAILAGEREFGVTVFQIDSGMDTGPIYRQKTISIDHSLCATEVLERLSSEGSALIDATIDEIKAGSHPTPQEGAASYAPKISKSELHLNLSQDGSQVLRQALAFTREPGVWFTFRGKRHIVTAVARSEEDVPTGKIAVRMNQALLGTEGRAIEILSIIPEGKREMTGREWASGLRLRDGDVSEEVITD